MKALGLFFLYLLALVVGGLLFSIWFFFEILALAFLYLPTALFNRLTSRLVKDKK